MPLAIARRRAVLVLGAQALAASLPRGARAQGVTTVRIGAAVSDDMTPALYALQAGLFKRAGLDVTLQIANSGAALAAAVAGGSVDIAKSTLLALITAHAHGVPFKLVAAGGEFDAAAPTGELVVLTTSAIKSPGDLGAKTVAMTSLRALDQLATEALVDQHGGDSSTIKFVEMQSTVMLPALEQGSIDAASIPNPVLQAVLETGKARAIGDPYDAFGKRFMITGWFCTESFATQNPTTVQRFTEALRQATLYTNAHPADTVDLLAAYTHIDPAVIRKMNRLTCATSIDRGDVQRIIDSAVKYKFIERGFSVDELL